MNPNEISANYRLTSDIVGFPVEGRHSCKLHTGRVSHFRPGLGTSFEGQVLLRTLL